MQRDNKLTDIRDFIVRNCKKVFPVVVVVVVALTVVIALNLNQEKASAEENNGQQENTVSGGDGTVQGPLDLNAEVPLVANEDSDIYSLVATYYNAKGTGDMDTLVSIYDVVPENDLLRYKETSKYLDYYTELQVYTKKGPEEGSVIAYVYYRVCFVDHEEEFPGYETLYICRNDQGQLYIKNEVSFTQEEKDYIIAITAQDDMVEFNNRVTVEYNDLLLSNPSLFDYLNELGRQVDASIGVTLAEQNVDASSSEDEGQPEEDQNQEGAAAEPQEPVQAATPQYATATTTVNVRSSDSEQADKLGKVESGSRLQVQEVGVNGWTKVVYEGKDGYIKSEFLEFTESAANQDVIGTVTATTNINIRAAANESSERLGMLPGGASLDLLAVEGDWCKVSYEGQAAYVKAEFVEQH